MGMAEDVDEADRDAERTQLALKLTLVSGITGICWTDIHPTSFTGKSSAKPTSMTTACVPAFTPVGRGLNECPTRRWWPTLGRLRPEKGSVWVRPKT